MYVFAMDDTVQVDMQRTRIRKNKREAVSQSLSGVGASKLGELFYCGVLSGATKGQMISTKRRYNTCIQLFIVHSQVERCAYLRQAIVFTPVAYIRS